MLNASSPGGGPAGPASGDSFDSALIARLANELYREFQNGERVPGIPGAGAGAEPSGLAGAYPAGTQTAAPPVHQSVTTVPAPDSETAPAPDSSEAGDSHAFGEPRCFRGSQGTAARELRGGASADKPEPAQARNGDRTLPLSGVGTDPFPVSDFYFLRGPEAAGGVPSSPSLPLGPEVLPLGFDVERIRGDFPALHQKVNGKQLIWLDNAATTHKPRGVIDATSRFYGRDNSNIHRAAHALAARATELYEGGREKVRQFLGAADAREIVFVRGTTEAINLLAQTYGRKFIGSGDEIVLTTMEHHANIVPWQMLAEQTGAVIRVAPINDAGELILDQFAGLLGPRTKLVAVTHVANALGTVNPVEQIIALAHAYGAPVLVDGAQSTPHLPINVRALDVDFLAFSGHKVFGPTGIGVLYGKSSWLEQMPPWQGGGNMIQDVTFAKTTYQSYPQKFEAGTQDIAGVVGLGAAVDYLLGIGLPNIAAYEHELLVYATEALATVPGLRPIGTASNKASVLSFVLDGFTPEQVGRHLDQNGIAVRSGHHCAQPALRRFGLNSTVRPSLAFYNTREEIDYLVRSLRQLRRNV